MSDTPESKVSKLWDKAIENGLIKTGYGLAAGGAVSLLFLRSHAWRAAVTAFSAGVGLGMSAIESKMLFEAQKPAPVVPSVVPAAAAAPKL